MSKKQEKQKIYKKMILISIFAFIITMTVSVFAGLYERNRIIQEKNEEMVHPTNKSVIGKWYCNCYNAHIILNIKNNGNYEEYNDSLSLPENNGKWEFNGKNLVLYPEANDRKILEFDAYGYDTYTQPTLQTMNTIHIGNTSGTLDCIFTKDAAELDNIKIVIQDKKNDVIRYDFEGIWKIKYISAATLIIPINKLDINPFQFYINVKEKTADLYAKNGIISSGVLDLNDIHYTLNKNHITFENINDVIKEMYILKDGTACLHIDDGSMEIELCMEKASDEEYYIIKNNIPYIGMTKDEVLSSSFGRPDDINTTITQYGSHEQWVYRLSNYKSVYLYFDDGILTSIQN